MLEVHNFTQNQIDEGFLEKIVEKVFKTFKIKDKIEISLAIVGEGRMRKLNKLYRGKNRVTDVLSFENRSVLPFLSKAFPRLKKGEDVFIEPPDKIKRLGEIIICYPQVKKQAKQFGHRLEKELTILLIHGILHLLEYNHDKKVEEKVLAEFKI